MNKNELKDKIRSTKGKFFSITFIKVDGSTRVANGKDFYKRLIRGGESTHADSKSVPFVDRNKDDFIAAQGESVHSFRCGSIVYPEPVKVG